MKVLIAVLTCHKYRDRANAVRETWAKSVEGADIRFFLGNRVGNHRMNCAPGPDEVVLDVDDGYLALPAKAQAMNRWALENGYEHVAKCDDDVYIQPQRLLDSGFVQYDYVGRLRGSSGGYPAPYASGLCYWLSARACRVLAESAITGHTAEDRWVGNALLAAGISCHHDRRYVVVKSPRNSVCFPEGPCHGNNIIAACEFGPVEMRKVHAMWESGQPSKMVNAEIPATNLSRIDVLIKTFLRDGFLFKAVQDIQQHLPGMRMVIVDDGLHLTEKVKLDSRLGRIGHAYVWLPYDSGFGAKANAGIHQFRREYVLIGSDDFDFSGPGVREGIERMMRVLDHDPTIGVASGRVDGVPYEGIFEGPENGKLKEVRGYHGRAEVDGIAYHLCDLTVNYSLIRRELVFAEVRWDGDVKIGGGEHGAFFLDLKHAGINVAYVEGVNINQVKQQAGWVHRDYPAMRGRARRDGRPCLKNRGVNEYVLFNGAVERC